MKNKYKELSVIVKNKNEFDKIKLLLGEEVIYIDWIEAMQNRETAIVLLANKKTYFSKGTIGCAKSQKEAGLKIVEFNTFF